MRKLYIIILHSIILSSCVKSPSFGPAQRERVSIEAKEMLINYLEAMKNEGLMSEFKYLDHSKDFFWVPPGFNSALSYDSVRIIIEANAKAIQSVSYKYDTLFINPLSLEIANYSAIVSGNLVDTAGIISPVRLIESGVLIKRKDGWKLLSGQSAMLPLKN